MIGSRPGWINAAVDVGKGMTGFLAGVVAGVFGSIWDTLTGLWELAEGIVDTIRGVLDGSLFASIADIYDTITTMPLEDVKWLVTEIVTMGKNAFSDFARKWDHPDTYQQCTSRATSSVPLRLEVILAIFSGGCHPGGEGAGQDRQVLSQADAGPRQAAGPGEEATRRPRSGSDHDGRRDRDDEDLSNADRAWEQARAMAAMATEEHDRRDTPVATLIPMLNATIAAKFSVVKGYDAILPVTGTYQIVQRARQKDVDRNYTEAPRFTSNVGQSRAYGRSVSDITGQARRWRSRMRRQGYDVWVGPVRYGKYGHADVTVTAMRKGVIKHIRHFIYKGQ